MGLSFADPDPAGPSEADGQKAVLRERFGRSGWECPHMLTALDATDDLYFDRVSQLRDEGTDPAWAKGRVALVGDAAFCVSLLVWEDRVSALTRPWQRAYVLAGEPAPRQGRHEKAFARYHGLFCPFVSMKQRAALCRRLRSHHVGMVAVSPQPVVPASLNRVGGEGDGRPRIH